MSDGEQPDDTQKTEDPTPKKLEDARKKGQVAMSREINNWVMILAATILIGGLSVTFFQQLDKILIAYIQHAHDFPSIPGGLNVLLGEGMRRVMVIMAMPLLLLMAAAFLAPFVQVGPIFAPNIIKP